MVGYDPMYTLKRYLGPCYGSHLGRKIFFTADNSAAVACTFHMVGRQVEKQADTHIFEKLIV